MDNIRFWKFLWQLHNYDGAVQGWWKRKVADDSKPNMPIPGMPTTPGEKLVPIESLANMFPDLISMSKGGE